MKSDVNFKVTPLNKEGPYYGFTLEKPLHQSTNGIILHNSGKSVMEQAIVGHVSRYSDRFQLVGVDCKRVEFNLLRGVKGVKGVALDVPTAAATVSNFQQQMMRRFKFMEDMQVNNIYKIKNQEVNYYTVFGKTVQFDEMYELTIDLDKKMDKRQYEKLLQIYGDGRQPLIITIEEIYEGMQSGRWEGLHPQLPVVKGYNTYLDRDTIEKTKGIFTPKALLFLADELNELMTSDDYKSVDTVKSSLGSIARLGRAAGVHLALACQRASGSTISTDLKNNIQMACLLGGFDDGASQLMFEKDISNLAKPEIKGRGFIQSGNEIIETQTYYTQPDLDWEFDTDMLLTYNNPEFKKQCSKRNVDYDALNTGWVEQKPYDADIEDEDDDDDENTLGRRGGFRDEDFTSFEDDFMTPRKRPTKKPKMEEPKADKPEMKFKFGDNEINVAPPKVDAPPAETPVEKTEVSSEPPAEPQTPPKIKLKFHTPAQPTQDQGVKPFKLNLKRPGEK